MSAIAKTTSIASATQPPASMPSAVASCSGSGVPGAVVVAVVSAISHRRLHCRARFGRGDRGARYLGDDLARGVGGDTLDRRQRGIARRVQLGIGLGGLARQLGIRLGQPLGGVLARLRPRRARRDLRVGMDRGDLGAEPFFGRGRPASRAASAAARSAAIWASRMSTVASTLGTIPGRRRRRSRRA